MEAAQHILCAFEDFCRLAPLPACCIYCGENRVRLKEIVYRTASLLIAGVVLFLAGVPCRRVHCLDCHRSWRQRPPGIVSHRHYQLCVVAKGSSTYLFEPGATLERVATACCCSRWTLVRWVRWIAGLARPEDLQARIVEHADAPLLVPVRGVADLERKSKPGPGRVLLVTAARVLSLLEALALVVSLEPPGLRSVVAAVIGDRPGRTTYARPMIPEFAHIGHLPI
jgi:hypothetical protein